MSGTTWWATTTPSSPNARSTRAVDEARGRGGRLTVLAVFEMPLDPRARGRSARGRRHPAQGAVHAPAGGCRRCSTPPRPLRGSGLAVDYAWGAGVPGQLIVDVAEERRGRRDRAGRPTTTHCSPRFRHLCGQGCAAARRLRGGRGRSDPPARRRRAEGAPGRGWCYTAARGPTRNAMTPRCWVAVGRGGPPLTMRVDAALGRPASPSSTAPTTRVALRGARAGRPGVVALAVAGHPDLAGLAHGPALKVMVAVFGNTFTVAPWSGCLVDHPVSAEATRGPANCGRARHGERRRERTCIHRCLLVRLMGAPPLGAPDQPESVVSRGDCVPNRHRHEGPGSPRGFTLRVLAGTHLPRRSGRTSSTNLQRIQAQTERTMGGPRQHRTVGAGRAGIRFSGTRRVRVARCAAVPVRRASAAPRSPCPRRGAACAPDRRWATARISAAPACAATATAPISTPAAWCGARTAAQGAPLIATCATVCSTNISTNVRSTPRGRKRTRGPTTIAIARRPSHAAGATGMSVRSPTARQCATTVAPRAPPATARRRSASAERHGKGRAGGHGYERTRVARPRPGVRHGATGVPRARIGL